MKQTYSSLEIHFKEFFVQFNMDGDEVKDSVKYMLKNLVGGAVLEPEDKCYKKWRMCKDILSL